MKQKPRPTKDRRITFRLEENTAKALEKIAADRGLYVSELLREYARRTVARAESEAGAA